MFTQELERSARLLPSHLEMGLAELIGHGRITCDSFGGLRRLLTPEAKRRARASRHAMPPAAGRWSLLPIEPRTSAGGEGRGAPGGDAVLRPGERPAPVAAGDDGPAAFVAQRLLHRWGVVFKRLLERERIPVPWRDVVREMRRMELRGEVRGGRFVARFAGEQYALAGAVEMMRRLRKSGSGRPVHVAAADPLNLRGILTPDERVPVYARRRIRVGA